MGARARATGRGRRRTAVGGEELDLLSVAGGGEDLGDEVLGHLLGLRRQHAEGELAQLGRRVVEQQLREDHPRRERVHVHLRGRVRQGVGVRVL